MTLMPALFIGHGSPMNTLERNGFTEAWRGFGARLPRPRAQGSRRSG
jgi:4,5-DOPA dioxygenase extradiol